MEISRILRVLITILLAVSFIIVTFAAYQRDQEVESMVKLSDTTSSIATRLSIKDLAWIDEEGKENPYILDNDSANNLTYSSTLGGENYAYRIQISYIKNEEKESLGPYGPEPPEEVMTGSLTVPTSLYYKGSIIPAKLKVTTWRT
ncbi:MAG: hypothetical protein KGY45_01275 [Hadesarchaea archaeon]|nr:hypothetical protein [Hadesarchaea archaeon]